MKTMSQIVGVLAAVSLLGMVGCCRSPDATSTAQPQLPGEELNLVHDVGSVLEGAQVEHVFPIENELSVPIAIVDDGDIEKTCGCITLEASSRRLEPGEKATIRLRVDTNGKSGRFRVGGLIRWRAENSESWPMNLYLEGNAKTLLASQPGLVQFSPDEVAEGTAKELLIFNAFEVDWATLHIEIDPPNVEVLETKIHDDHVKLLLRARPLAEHVDFSASLKLTATLAAASGAVKNCAIAVPLQGSQTIDLQVSPRVVFASWSPELQKGTARFLVRGPASESLASISSISCEGLRAAWTTTAFVSLNRTGYNTLQVELRLTEPDDPAFDSRQARRVRIVFAGGRSVEVPVYLVAQQARS